MTRAPGTGPGSGSAAGGSGSAAGGSGSAAGGAARLPQGQAKVAAVRAMFDAIAPRYDLVNRVMTLNLDRGWRRHAVRSLGLPPRSLVLDLATGTGDLCRDLVAAGHRPVGLDLSRGMLAHARTTAPLIQGDGLDLPLPGRSLDGVVSGFALRNVIDLPALFAELARVVRPGGRAALLDIGRPANPLLRLGHAVYFGRVVPRIGAALSDADAYRYLPRSLAYLPDPPALVAQLREAGWGAVERRTLTGGVAQLLTGTRERERDR
ncbi:MAG: ubiquinone/menaquinone biosynthesis methyltransferase [Acidimicrobiales bacterium]